MRYKNNSTTEPSRTIICISIVRLNRVVLLFLYLIL